MEKAKVMIAIPNLGSIHPDLAMKLIRWSTVPTQSIEQVAVFMPNGLVPHDCARNFCVNHFLKSDATHLFFIDDDVIPQDDALEQLVSADLDVISGLYSTMRKNKGVPTKIFNVFRHGEDENGGYGLIPLMDGEGGIVQISRAGAGCLMIKRSVIESMTSPWFKFQYREDGTVAIGEDIDFCAKAERAGYKIYAHLDVKCGHAKDVIL